MIIPHLPTGFKLAAHRSRCISGLLTNTGLLTLAVMTKVLEKQAANRERRLCAELAPAARTVHKKYIIVWYLTFRLNSKSCIRMFHVKQWKLFVYQKAAEQNMNVSRETFQDISVQYCGRKIEININTQTSHTPNRFNP